jgi:hypothetical protein
MILFPCLIASKYPNVQMCDVLEEKKLVAEVCRLQNYKGVNTLHGASKKVDLRR